MKSITALSEAINNIDIENDVEPSFVEFKVVRLYANNETKNLTGNDKTKANSKNGVYRHKIVDGPIMYIGKAERSTIAQRNASHLTTFRKPLNTNEMSGKKYRNYIEENKLEYIDIQIEYIDLTQYPTMIIPMLELQLMEYYQPILNQETSI